MKVSLKLEGENRYLPTVTIEGDISKEELLTFIELHFDKRPRVPAYSGNAGTQGNTGGSAPAI